ncbi:HAD-IB family phosphatase [filamentous cyanobacterium LEGE 11480]|uniref:HAD-IB family phosphatase n=1 Tax=Romeriopsis navalis LEGE 11480 TaxID=2777977 RepID=A0A928Z439_9CYAN|nr:HAD-IB family phosphatase [Romeriopsis navalis]MBE9029928.1 HAD-IB family phosphatase [Romeriopsis navalis LEGE 11480]
MKRIVFCDFDGTISAEETFVALLRKFTPSLAEQLMPEMYARRLTLREGVRQLLESIPSTQYPELIAFSKAKAVMRPGLPELLDFLDRQSVPFVVISGGVQVMVETILGDLVKRMAGVHAVQLETSGERLKAVSPFEDGTELVSKVKIIAEYDCDEAIAIGDSITDLNMALNVPVVFARDRLAIYLQESETPYFAWEDFHDVRKSLAQQWGVQP